MTVLYNKIKNIKKIINEEVNKGLSSILLNITLPIMIISSFLIKYDEEGYNEEIIED